MQEHTEPQAEPLPPEIEAARAEIEAARAEIEAARAEMHRLVDAAFDAESAARVVLHAADETGVTSHVAGLSAAEYAQVMEATYAQYQKRYCRNTPEVLQ